MIIKPQKGFQEKFLSTSADIAIGGGSAGAGKTYALLLEDLRHYQNPNFGSVTFRRTSPQIRGEGGLWDTSLQIYNHVGAAPKESSLQWAFKSGAKASFRHLEYEKNVLDWQGTQLPLIKWDELTHFSANMFFYLLSRNRSTCGVKPYMRATCNPDPDSWVAEFISWWIDQDTGYPIPERDGQLRYFMRNGEEYFWGDSVAEVVKSAEAILHKYMKKSSIVKPEDFIKSLTFIHGDIYGNEELLKVNPAYLGNLISQSEAERAMLLEGNWKVRLDGHELYEYSKFKDCFTNDFDTLRGKRYLTGDIAGKGSDLFIVGFWDGFRLEDITIMEKSEGDEILDVFYDMANQYKVPQSNIAYDNDGIGQFISGFLKNAYSFVNNSKAINGENFQNLKAQCYYKSADRVNDGCIYISPLVANKMVKNKTIRQHFMREMRVIRRHKPDHDGKLCILPKEEQKAILGNSPDFMDMFMMREVFEIKPEKKVTHTRVKGIRI